MNKAYLVITSYLIVLIFIVTQKSNSQNIQWQNSIGGIDEDFHSTIRQTNDGGYILGGRSLSNISCDKTENNLSPNYDLWIIKIDSGGNIQWQNTIGGNDVESFASIDQTADGGYILGGSSASNISGDKTENGKGNGDYWIIKTDASGNIQWQNTIGGSDRDDLISVHQTTDGGYILGGFSFSSISADKTENCIGYNDYWIVKTDMAGNIQWQNTIGGSWFDYLTSIEQTTDGGYIIGGYSGSSISSDKSENCYGFNDYWIVKTDGAGNILWENTIGGMDVDALYAIHQTLDGGYILGGLSGSNISVDKTENCIGNDDFWMVKTDGAGNIQWQNTIGGNESDILYCIQQTSDGGYIFGGSSLSNMSGDKVENRIGFQDFWVLKTDSTGNILWQNTIGGTRPDDLRDIHQTTDGGYILGGSSLSNISGDKTENNCDITYATSDYWIIKLYPDNMTPILNSEVENLDLKLFPNPAKDEITIELNNLLTINHGQPLSILVFDVLGNIIFRERTSTSNNSLPTANFSNGVYFVEVKTNKKVYRAKFVKE